MNQLKVAVTGGSGYIASWIIKELMEAGHHVNTSVRHLNQKEKYQHLLDLEATSPGSLTLFEADLTTQGAFDPVFEGVTYVFHTASPFLISDTGDTMKTLVTPAVDGTKNVLSSVNSNPSVKRVVLTSSVVAMYGDALDLANQNFTIDERMWNTTSSPTYNAYAYSKTMAEKAAWAMVEQQSNWDLVTIHPAFVMGPSLTQRKDSASISTLLRLLSGEMKIGSPKLTFAFSDVRDIAKGHLLAAFTEEAKGRYIIANESADFKGMADRIGKAFPGDYPLPKRYIPKWFFKLIAPTVGMTRRNVENNVGYDLRVNNNKSIKDLGMTYHPLAETLVDHVRQLKKDQLI